MFYIIFDDKKCDIPGRYIVNADDKNTALYYAKESEKETQSYVDIEDQTWQNDDFYTVNDFTFEELCKILSMDHEEISFYISDDKNVIDIYY